MNKNIGSLIKNRAIIKVSGKDSLPFLQNIVTNDLNEVSKISSIYSALLTPQGKFFCDFIISKYKLKNLNYLLLECDLDTISSIINKLALYKMRSNVNIEDVTNEYKVVALTTINNDLNYKIKNLDNNIIIENSLIFIDPRSKHLGARVYLSNEEYFTFINRQDVIINNEYEQTRIKLGIPEGMKDIIPEKDFILDYGFNELNGVSFTKGCYIGQEITARTFNRGKIKKSIYCLSSQKDLPDCGTEIFLKD
ncbi:hypothetical protein OAK17_08515, partial [Alphaproteobacteria bacterium]|nr:hypothetical protein [Alphaproteobacteria bacterium]